jgi:hypothetical protein
MLPPLGLLFLLLLLPMLLPPLGLLFLLLLRAFQPPVVQSRAKS